MRPFALAAIAAATLSCAGFRSLPPRLPDCPGAIPTVSSLPAGDATWRERARYVGGEVDAGVEAVAPNRDVAPAEP